MELTSHQVGYYLVVITTLHIGLFWIMNWSAIVKGLKGDDGIFQSIEIIAYVSTVLWPAMLMADSFFGFRASAEAWTSINLVIAVAVLGISYNKFLQHKETVIEKKLDHEEKIDKTKVEVIMKKEEGI